MSTSNRTLKWIENLAAQELLIKSGARTSIDIGTTQDEVLSVETSTFFRDLAYHVDFLIRHFNHHVADDVLKLKLVRSEHPESLTISRNGMRLSLFCNEGGKVNITCDKLLALDGMKGTRPSVMSSGLVEARFGNFHDVEWMFLGSRVTAEQVARHYLTEFIQMSRVTGSG